MHVVQQLMHQYFESVLFAQPWVDLDTAISDPCNTIGSESFEFPFRDFDSGRCHSA
jgi:hypothetical protein